MSVEGKLVSHSHKSLIKMIRRMNLTGNWKKFHLLKRILPSPRTRLDRVVDGVVVICPCFYVSGIGSVNDSRRPKRMMGTDEWRRWDLLGSSLVLGKGLIVELIELLLVIFRIQLIVKIHVIFALVILLDSSLSQNFLDKCCLLINIFLFCLLDLWKLLLELFCRLLPFS